MKKYQEARSNVICGVLAQLFSIGFYLETYHCRLVKNVNTVNAAFFPRVIACVVFFCATLLVIQGLKQYRSTLSFAGSCGGGPLPGRTDGRGLR